MRERHFGFLKTIKDKNKNSKDKLEKSVVDYAKDRIFWGKTSDVLG